MKIDFKDMKGLNVPKYCRKIMKKQDYPKTLEIYRDDVLCLHVDVMGASKLRLVENDKEGPLYKKYYDSGFLDPVACHVETTGEFK